MSMKSIWKDEQHPIFDACSLIAWHNDGLGVEVVTSILDEVAGVKIPAVQLLCPLSSLSRIMALLALYGSVEQAGSHLAIISS